MPSSVPVIRAVGYAGSLQRAVIPAGYLGYIVAYLWGGGGGAGGWDGSGQGGNGSGSGYAEKTIVVNPGDVITLAVGEAGDGGTSNINQGGAGMAGASYIGSGFSYSGAYGGYISGVGNGGSAAGGGGATVLLINGVVQAVAGGGGGGAGAASLSTKAITSAPGPRGQEPSSHAGENGLPGALPGGGGGGGYYGGNGGYPTAGVYSGEGGSYGTSYGDAIANPTNWQAAGADNPYYREYAGEAGKGSLGDITNGLGGRGRNGAAVILFFGLGGIWVHQSGSFTRVPDTWVKNNGVWSRADSIYVKQNGSWKSIKDSVGNPPTFAPVAGNWGVDPRGGIPPMGMGMGNDPMGDDSDGDDDDT